MFFLKQNLVLQILILSYTLSRSCAIECKVCEKDDAQCLFEFNNRRVCENDDDLCYSWFSRTVNDVGVQRNCISRNSLAYYLIRRIVEGKYHGCIKRIRGFDCFTLCSTDLCN